MAGKLTKQDKGEIQEYRKLFPKTIKVLVIPFEEGGYGARVFGFSGSIITEGKSFSELIFMVNDVIRCVFEVPEKYYSLMPEYMPPLTLAQKFNEFPKFKKEETVELFSSAEGCVAAA